MSNWMDRDYRDDLKEEARTLRTTSYAEAHAPWCTCRSCGSDEVDPHDYS